MYNKILVVPIFLLLLFGGRASAQEVKQASWTDLMDITFKEIYIESQGIYMYYPLFGQKQQALNGRRVAITGYMIPVDVEQNQYVLSAFPFSACFFCGNAGPESVMAVYFRTDDRSFQTDERLTLEGTLQLNDSDVDELVYVLEDAVVKR